MIFLCLRHHVYAYGRDMMVFTVSYAFLANVSLFISLLSRFISGFTRVSA